MQIQLRSYRLAVFAILFSIVSAQLTSGTTQEKVPLSGNVLFQMTTLNWGISNSVGCKRILNLRLYADGKVEYDQCQTRALESGRSVDYLVRKESRAEKKDIEELVGLIETSGLLESKGPAHSGLNATDVGWNMTLLYCNHGREKSLEVRNYITSSKMIPEWLHKIIRKALSLVPAHE